MQEVAAAGNQGMLHSQGLSLPLQALLNNLQLVELLGEDFHLVLGVYPYARWLLLLLVLLLLRCRCRAWKLLRF